MPIILSLANFDYQSLIGLKGHSPNQSICDYINDNGAYNLHYAWYPNWLWIEHRAQ